MNANPGYRADEVETPAVLHAWKAVLDLIESLSVTKMIPGHLERGWELDYAADLAYNRKYLGLLEEKVFLAHKAPGMEDLKTTFTDMFPDATKNREFFIGHLTNQFGEGGKVWAENKHQNVGARTQADLEGYQVDKELSKSKSVLPYTK